MLYTHCTLLDKTQHIVFDVVNHRPTYHIDVADRDENDGDEETPKPDAPLHPEVKKIKEDLEQ
jgi:hypothetical protein